MGDYKLKINQSPKRSFLQFSMAIPLCKFGEKSFNLWENVMKGHIFYRLKIYIFVYLDKIHEVTSITV